jgi:signal transduction histidine kinase
MAVATTLGTTDLMIEAGLSVPMLSNVGILVGNVLLASVVSRVGAFERKPTFADALAAGALALTFVGLVLVAVYALDRTSAIAAVATAIAVLAVLGSGRVAWQAFQVDRAQIQQFATLGRISAQLAHDLKNPLAAFRGAAQFLQVEAERGNDLRAHQRFFDILIEQADRMHRVIDSYQRLGKMTPDKAEPDLNRVVSSVLALQQFAAGDRITVRAELAEKLPRCPVDPELVGTALENLLANAFQALSAGGEVTVTTRRELVDGNGFCVLGVSDNGPGMDARTRERAGEEFFTTKTDGTGLGLAFVRRIGKAHGGRLQIDSARGRGTRVELWLPSDAGPT